MNTYFPNEAVVRTSLVSTFFDCKIASVIFFNRSGALSLHTFSCRGRADLHILIKESKYFLLSFSYFLLSFSVSISIFSVLAK